MEIELTKISINKPANRNNEQELKEYQELYKVIYPDDKDYCKDTMSYAFQISNNPDVPTQIMRSESSALAKIDDKVVGYYHIDLDYDWLKNDKYLLTSIEADINLDKGTQNQVKDELLSAMEAEILKRNLYGIQTFPNDNKELEWMLKKGFEFDNYGDKDFYRHGYKFNEDNLPLLVKDVKTPLTTPMFRSKKSPKI